MTINKKQDLLDWCDAYIKANKANKDIIKELNELKIIINDVQLEVTNDPEHDLYFLNIIDKVKKIGLMKDIKNPNSLDQTNKTIEIDTPGAVCSQMEKPSGLTKIAKNINIELKQKNEEAAKLERAGINPKELAEIKSQLEDELKLIEADEKKLVKAGASANCVFKADHPIRAELQLLNLATSNLPINDIGNTNNQCTKRDCDADPGSAMKIAMKHAQDHIKYFNYIKNIEITVAAIAKQVGKDPALESTTNTLKSNIEEFKNKPLEEKEKFIENFHALMKSNLNELDSKMGGRDYRILQTLIEKAKRACDIMGLPGVVGKQILSLGNSMIKSRFGFFDKNKENVKKIKESAKTINPLLDKPKGLS